MALSIKHPEADRLAREVSQRTGESLTEIVVRALRELLLREQGRAAAPAVSEAFRTLRQRGRKLRVIDGRSPEEILDYDEQGLPR